MIPRIIKITAIAVGLISVVISIIYGNEDTRFIKPFFHILLFSFYWLTTKKFNLLLLLFLLSAMVAEFFTAINFEDNFRVIVSLFAAFFLLGFILQFPVLKRTTVKKLGGQDVFSALAGIFVLSYIIITVFTVSNNELADFTFLSIGTLCFSAFIASCFYIAGFNKHPKKIYLFITGVCYVLVTSGALLYELTFKSPVLIGIINLSEITAQFSFVYFLIYKNKILTKGEWLI